MYQGSIWLRTANWWPKFTQPIRRRGLNACLLVSNPLLFPLHQWDRPSPPRASHWTDGKSQHRNTQHGLSGCIVFSSTFLCYPCLRFQSRVRLHLAECHTVRHDITTCLRNRQRSDSQKIPVSEGHFLQTLSCWTQHIKFWFSKHARRERERRQSQESWECSKTRPY